MRTRTFRHTLLLTGLSLVLLALAGSLASFVPEPAAAETLDTCTVTNHADSGPGTLRALIADTSCTTINFARDDTITLTSQLKLTRRPLTIDGTGYHITISGGNTTRVFWANGGSCNNGIGGDYASSDDWRNGQITLKNLTIANGTATNGGGLYYYGNLCYGEDSSEQGGDAWTNHRTPGNLNLINVTFLNNTATSTGGGAFLDNNYDVDVMLGPSAPVLTNVTFSGNSTPNLGGALGILNGGAMMTNLTFVGNSASAGGAAIWYRYAAWGATDSSGNLALRLRNAIIWGNTTGSGVSQQYKWIMEQSGGTQLAVSNSDIEGGYSGTGNINLAPRLSALGDYGGSTDTYALLPGGPLIDATSSNCPETDQRGLTRSTPSCDLGAFESQGFTLTPTTGSNQSAGVYKVFATPLALTVTANSVGEPVAGGTITFTAPTTGASTLPTVMTTTIGASGAASVTVRANGTLGGPYVVTATTTGASPASFTGLRNVCASTIVVRNANDSGAGSLREALIAICEGGEINFAGNFEITLQSELPVTQSMTIDAMFQAITVSTNGSVRAFNVSAGHTLSLEGFTVADGQATGADGGGVYNAGTLNLTNMTFRGNAAASGGGIYNAGNLSITNSTFSANSAGLNGGALYNAAGTPVLTNVTMGNNTAASGGGIYNRDSSLTVRNSIVWGGSGGAIVNAGTGSATVTYSAVQGGYAGTGNTGSDPLLSSLGRYDTGVLDTFALLPGSAAIDAANGAYCPTTDERGRSRVGTCDMGAFESQGFTISRISGHEQSTVVNTDFPTLLLLGVTPRVGIEPVVGGKVALTGPSSGAGIVPSSFVATVNADSEIEATLTANGIAGGPYIITATAAGAGDPKIIDKLMNTCFSSATVTTAGDSGSGSLRDAITYLCPNGTITFASNTTVTLASTLTIAKNLTIDGTGYAVTLSGGNAVRVFSVSEGYTLNLVDLTVANGKVAGASGGGTYNAGTLNLSGVTFRDNTAASGGAIYNGGTLAATNSAFYGNSATSAGGALDNAAGSATLTLVTVSHNTAASGGGVYNAAGLTLRNSILWGSGALTNASGGSATVTYSDVQGGYGGTGNLNADPAFVDAAGGDLRLRHDSPAIDAGDTTGVTATTDLAGNPRVMGMAVDMGAYEVQQATRAVPAGTWLDFGPELCGRIWFTNTGTLPTSIAITLTYEMPFTVTGASLLERRYQIDAQGGAGYQAMVELCYDAEDLTHAGIADAADLVAYRNGVRYVPSSVDTTDRIVTAFGVTGFSVWTLGDSYVPSAVRMHVLSAAGTTPAAVLLGLVAVATVVGMTRRRRS